MAKYLGFLPKAGVVLCLVFSVSACTAPFAPEVPEASKARVATPQPDPRAAKWQSTCGAFELLLTDIQAGSVTADQLVERVSELDAVVETAAPEDVRSGIKSLLDGMNAQDEALLNSAASSVRAACTTWAQEIDPEAAAQ